MKKKWMIVTMVLFLIPIVLAFSGSSTDYILKYGIIGLGQGNGESASYKLKFVMPDQPLGIFQTSSYKLYLGHYHLIYPPTTTTTTTTSTTTTTTTTSTTTTIISCSGPISLTLNPNPLNYTLNKTVLGTVSGLSNCNERNATIREVACYDTYGPYGIKCTCTVSGSGCSCSFSPNIGPGGYYTYYVCLDINQNVNYETGEYDTEVLRVYCGSSGQTCNANKPCCGGYVCYAGFCKPTGGGGGGRVIDK